MGTFWLHRFCMVLLTLIAHLPLYGQTFTFRDATQLANIVVPTDSGYGHGIAVADYNQDGYLDIFTIFYENRNTLHINQQDGTFLDMAEAWDAQGSFGWRDRGIAAADYNNDGYPDFLLHIAGSNSLIYRNTGSGMFDVLGQSTGIFDRGQSQGVIWGDFNDDGRLDVVLLNFSTFCQFYFQNADNTFTEATSTVGMAFIQYAIAGVAFDADNDGDLDMIIGRGEGYGNLLFLNRGNGTFVERGERRGVAMPDLHSQGITLGDYDRDGDLDIYIANSKGANALFRNRGNGYFDEVGSTARANESRRSVACNFADFDNDGWPDIFVGNFGPKIIYHNNGDGTFSMWSDANLRVWTSTYGSCAADFDHDGDLDIYVSNSGNESKYYENLADPGNWLEIIPEGSTSNRDALGCNIDLWKDGRVQRQVIASGSAFVSGNRIPAHFGLGQADYADSVRITWPAGGSTFLSDPVANQRIRVVEGQQPLFRRKFAPPDSIPPQISAIQAGNVFSGSATIFWQTDEPSTGHIGYGPDPLLGQTIPADTAARAAHARVLTGLQPNSQYYFSITARDDSGNVAISDTLGFFTADVSPVPLYAVHEIRLVASADSANPYLEDPDIRLTFTGIAGDAAGQVLAVQAYWHGDSTFAVRFAPPAFGLWQWQAASADSAVNGLAGSIDCSETLPAGHAAARGPVRVSTRQPAYFVHADGTPFYLLGDTQWSFATTAVAWPDAFQTYVQARQAQGFNAVLGLVYSLPPQGNAANPGDMPFVEHHVDRLNPDFWQALDQRVAYLNEHGLVAALVLARADGAWQKFSTQDEVLRFVDYVARRYSAYNVIWFIAGDYEQAEPPGGYAAIGAHLLQADPYRHPISIISLDTAADDFGAADWLAFITRQGSDAGAIGRDRTFGKPVLNADFGYEGDISADVLRRRAWGIAMQGGFFFYGNRATAYDDAQMTDSTLYSPGVRAMQALKTFWRDSSNYRIPWWEFSRFETLAAGGWLAAKPGAAYVLYADSTAPISVDFPGASERLAGQWFDCKSSDWREIFTFPGGGTATLKPPDADFAAFIHPVQDTLPPQIGAVIFAAAEAGRQQIVWRTDAPAAAVVDFGADSTLGQTVADYRLHTGHAIWLDTPAADAWYYFRVRNIDAAGNESRQPIRAFFKPEITVAPIITDLAITAVGSDSAVIRWQTHIPALVAVDYGPGDSLAATTMDPVLRTEHRVALENLQDSLAYGFRIHCWSASGFETVLSGGQFTTRLDRQPPVIAAIRVSEVTDSSAVIHWQTDEASRSWLQYRDGAGASLQTPPPQEFRRVFRDTLENLQANTTYSFRVLAEDRRGNRSASADSQFTTAPGVPESFSFRIPAPQMTESRNVVASAVDSSWQILAGGFAGASIDFSVGGNYLLQFRARAEAGGEQWPGLALHIDSVQVGVIQIQGEGFSRFGFSRDITPGRHTLLLRRQDAAAGRQDAGLWLQWLAGELVSSTGDSIAPEIRDLQIEQRRDDQITLRWQTDELAQTRAYYSLTANMDQIADAGAAYRTRHELTLERLLPDTVYYVQVLAEDPAGNVRFSEIVEFQLQFVSTGIYDRDGAGHTLPQRFRLSQNYPNPFNMETRFDLDVPENGELQVTIFDVNGKKVLPLYSGAVQAGYKVLRWDGRAAGGKAVASGVYLLRVRYDSVRHPGKTMIRRVVLMK